MPAQTMARGPSSDISSSMLSASINDPWDRSPPPKREADDYIGPQARSPRRRRRHHAKHHGQGSCHSQGHDQVSLLSDETAAERASRSDPRDSRDVSPTNSSKLSNKAPPQPRHASSSDIAFDARSETSPLNVPVSKDDLPMPSPALTALRRLSQVKTTRRRPGLRRNQTTSDHLKTPASITVRKASAAFPISQLSNNTMQGIVSNDMEEQPDHEHLQLAPPNVELIAFYSEHRPQLTRLHSNSGGAAPAEQCDVSIKNPAPKSSSFYCGHRQSEIADIALTFADVHVAPGSSRRGSLALRDVAQRVSAVQFRSRNSVHETVWREDEMASISSVSCSTHGSSSPEQSAQFQTISPLQSDAEVSSGRFSRSSTQHSTGIPFIEPEHPLSSGPTQAQIFSFPWGNNSKAALDPKAKGDVEGSKKSSPGIRSNSSAHVSFSPPMQDCQSSTKWDREPVFGAGSPFDGREEATSPLENQRIRSKKSSSSKHSSKASGEGSFTGRRASALPCGSPRLWEAGMPGSHLGISSHKHKSVRQSSVR